MKKKITIHNDCIFLRTFGYHYCSYFRVAELARWRITPASGLLSHNWRFLVVEQNIKYLSSIQPFQSYSVTSSVTTSDNKWLHYRHTFESIPTTGQDPVQFAIVDLKAVIKEPSGKTVTWCGNMLHWREVRKLSFVTVRFAQMSSLQKAHGSGNY